MAVVAVNSELVSREIPVLQGINRELFNFSLFSDQDLKYSSNFSKSYRQIP